jgi:methionyl-tRNA formyltransferase
MRINQSICIAGKNQIAINGLKYLIKNFKNHNIFYLANKSDSGKDKWQPSFRKFANSINVKLITKNDLYCKKDLIFISLEYESILNINKFKSRRLFNIHFSFLPKYKGMYTSVLPLLYGEKKTGVTIHKIERGIDTGRIVSQKEFKISQKWNAHDLYNKYMLYGYQIFKKNINKIIKNKISLSKQKSCNSFYYSKSHINFKELNIDFKKTAYQIQNQFRAYSFRPFQMPRFKGWNIYKTKILNSTSQFKAGKIVFQNNEYFRISSIDYDILLFKDYYPKFWHFLKKGDLKNLKKISKYIKNLNEKNHKGINGYSLAKANKQIDCLKAFINFRKNNILKSCNQKIK